MRLLFLENKDILHPERAKRPHTSSRASEASRGISWVGTMSGPGRRGTASVRWYYTARSNMAIFRSAMALPGFSPFGQVAVQFMPAPSPIRKPDDSFPAAHGVIGPGSGCHRDTLPWIGYLIHTTLLLFVIARSVATKQSRTDICVLRTGLLHPRLATRVRNDESHRRASEEPPLRREEA